MARKVIRTPIAPTRAPASRVSRPAGVVPGGIRAPRGELVQQGVVKRPRVKPQKRGRY